MVKSVVLKNADEEPETHEYAYKEASEPEADTVLVVAFDIPGLVDREELRFPLKRDPDASNSDIEPTGTGWAADGVSKDGHGIGHVGSIDLEGNTTYVTVQISMSGTGQDGNRVTVKETIQVPWLGHFEKKLAEGRQIAVHFEAPKK